VPDAAASQDPTMTPITPNMFFCVSGLLSLATIVSATIAARISPARISAAKLGSNTASVGFICRPSLSLR